MLLFSIKRGNILKAMTKASNLPEAVKFAIYFNILAIIVLEEAAERFGDEPSQETPQAFLVDGIVQYVEKQVAENVEHEEDSD